MDGNSKSKDLTGYVHGYDASVVRSYTWRTIHNSASYLIPYIKPTFSILDVGCGPGTITCDLARLVPQGNVVGVDKETSVIEQAESFANGQHINNIRFEVGDVFCLPFPDATFDIVHAHQVLQHVSEPIRALKEMKRVVKLGGHVAVRDALHATGFHWYPDVKGLRQVSVQVCNDKYPKFLLTLNKPEVVGRLYSTGKISWGRA